MWFVASVGFLSIVGGFVMGLNFELSDSGWYQAIADGKTAQVMQPFASRQLGPLVVRLLIQLTHLSLPHAFIVEGIFSILLLLSMVGIFLVRGGVPRWLLYAVGGLAFWPQLFQGFVLPDLWFSALLGVFLLLLSRKRYFSAALFLFPLQVSREATILVLLCFLIAGWRRIRLVPGLTAVVATYAGMRVVKMLTAGAVGNQEKISPLLYMAGKVPWNLLKNVLGLIPWNNYTPTCSKPIWSMPLHLGHITSVGVCSFRPENSLFTTTVAMTSFGLLPLFAAYCWKKKLLSLSPESVLLRFCLVYGAVSFLMAPMLGTNTPRLFGYGWPLFVVAVPLLIVPRITRSPRNAGAFLTLHLALSWSFLLFLYKGSFSLLLPNLLMLAWCILAYGAGWVLLSRGGFALSEKTPGTT
ncbi:MAG TPA: hypothetical protein VGB69_00065 [Edaphobacter sp.]